MQSCHFTCHSTVHSPGHCVGECERQRGRESIYALDTAEVSSSSSYTSLSTQSDFKYLLNNVITVNSQIVSGDFVYLNYKEKQAFIFCFPFSKHISKIIYFETSLFLDTFSHHYFCKNSYKVVTYRAEILTNYFQ